MNRITTVRVKNGAIAEYAYDAIGQLTRDVRGEVAITYDYNDLTGIE